ncbi:MAG: disulfide bond formation protein B [Pelagibacterales bacterium MED-G39]|mgnify:FL=1|jgi:disulfide bond formation protein DsbB|nr:disulfide bond formation protein B [Pelagibacterales bacterium SAG-MED14]MBD1171078.1 disulfide bond formation protein B [Pelagibacterales bacterium SAG-MED04]PDH17798.1 MAG: disulfide bond formation protein B [Pelagibacterales bacterium MED-G39]|tara:strand:+ start:254 stop:739 length:486 start_codon:yes stop_codon:yes gene_type:complete
MFNLSKKNLFTVIFLISFIALVSAYFIEYILGHQPCNLCLYERIPYFLAILIVLINYKYNKLEKYIILSLAIIFLIATILSLYHLGIEQGFIQESLLCDLEKGANILDKDEILKQLQQKNISCKDVTFKIFGLSLTSYNIIISILLTITLIRFYFGYENSR